MRFKAFLVSSLAAPALFAAAPAAAQDTPVPVPPPAAAAATPSGPGETFSGTIQVCEAARGEHRIRLEGGRRYTISATSDAFDTYLRLLRPGNDEPLAEDDDSGGGLNSRINYTPTESGEYIVRVTSFNPTGVGSYNLRVEQAAPPPPLLSRVTRTERGGQWRVYEGELTASDPADNSRHYEDYALTLTAGQRAMIYLESVGTNREGEENVIDPLLRVYSNENRGAEPLAENDDGGGGLNSFVFFAPEAAGTYVIRVTTFGENSTGRYRLRVSTQ